MKMVRVWGEHRRLPVLVRRNGRTAVGSESDGERRLGGSWAGMRPVRERRVSRAGLVWRPGRLLSGQRPRRACASRPRAKIASGLLQQKRKFQVFYFSEIFLDDFGYSLNFYSILHQRVYCLEIKEYSNASENRIPTCFRCKV